MAEAVRDGSPRHPAGRRRQRDAAEPALRRTLAFVRAAAARAAARRQRLLRRLSAGRGGLLDGRRATTHWGRADDFAPALSAGAAGAGPHLRARRRGLDLGRDHRRHRPGAGPDRRRPGRGRSPSATAQQLVVHHRRPGGQSQFSALLEMGGPEGPVRRAAGLGARAAGRAADRRAAGRPGRDEPAPLRPRLHRRDRRHAGQGGRAAAPGGGARARRGRHGADRPRRRAPGFGDPERMRRAFLRAFGQPPQALRRAAKAA